MSNTPLTAKAKIACGFQAVPQSFLEHAEKLERENRILREALREIKRETDVNRIVRLHFKAADMAYWLASDALKDTQKEAQPCQCTNGIIRCVGRDNEEIIEDCPRCSVRKEAQP